MIIIKNLKTAIIDIGSNTLRLVLYEYNQQQGLMEFGNFKTVARLRTFLLPSGEMSEEGILILQASLQSFKEILDDYNVSDIKAAATAAIRQAINQKEIIERMHANTGLYLEVLSEEEEAFYGFVAIAHSVDTPSAITIDIGGGSTEITYFENKKLQKTISFPFGTVSLKQKFVKDTIISSDELGKLREFVKKNFKSVQWLVNKQLPIIAIGGSARNIAQIHQHQTEYAISGIHQYELNLKELKELKYGLSLLTYEQLKQLDGLSADRADIIVPALQVFITLMEVVNTNQYQVSKKGLREGLIINRVLQNDPDAFNKYNVFEESAKRIARQYGRSVEETEKLEKLVEQFYLQCCKLKIFSYDYNQLNLLQFAAKLYGIGEYIELDSSNQHTFYLIANQSISGMNHMTRLKIALLASYKNKDYFRRFIDPFKSWISGEEQAVLRDFGAILKFIFALNISKRQVVEKIYITDQGEYISLLIEVNSSAVAEVYYAERQKKHIERVFKKPVKIHFSDEGVKINDD